MIPEGMKIEEAQKRLSVIKRAVGTRKDGGHRDAQSRLEAVRKRWAKECGKDYVPRRPAIGTDAVPVVNLSEEDRAEDRKNEVTRGTGRAKQATKNAKK